MQAADFTTFEAWRAYCVESKKETLASQRLQHRAAVSMYQRYQQDMALIGLPPVSGEQLDVEHKRLELESSRVDALDDAAVQKAWDTRNDAPEAAPGPMPKKRNGGPPGVAKPLN